MSKLKIKKVWSCCSFVLYLEDTSHTYKKKSKKKAKDPEAVRDIFRSFIKPVTESVTQTSTYAAPTVKVIKRHYYVELLLVLDNTVYEAWVSVIFSDKTGHCWRKTPQVEHKLYTSDVTIPNSLFLMHLQLV